MDDMLLYASPIMNDFVPSMLNYFSQHMNCEDPALRQAVLFGIKIIVEKYPQMISGQVKDILAALMNVIKSEQALDEDYVCATDNAVSAVFSILINFREALSPKEWNTGIEFILDYLPMQEDVAEAQTVHELLVNELLKPNHGIFNAPNLLDATMHLLPLLLLPTYDDGDNEYEVIYPETKTAIVNILKSITPNQLQQLIGSLEPEVKAAIMNAMQ